MDVVTIGATILLTVLWIGHRRYSKEVPEGWKKVYDVNECPYGQRKLLGTIEDVPLPDEAERILLSAVLSRPAITESVDDTLIPRQIMQTNELDDIPEGMYAATSTILSKNPNYDYIYFDDQRAREYLMNCYHARVIDAYDVLVPGAYKADLFRYCYLYREGGVYIDMGMVMLDGLDNFISGTDRFISPEDNGTGGLYNAFICAQSRHPILLEAINMCLANIEARNYTDSPLGITGPLLLARAFEKVTGKKVKMDTKYGDGIKIVCHYKPDECMSGEIFDKDRRVISTRSPSYRSDQKWYNQKPRYTNLWKQGLVYDPPLDKDDDTS